ncbi:MAG: Peroxide-responsive repressor PerR [Pelotomaculum sp. PtaU1.Bin035]|nr:MAG: Peroxide-responsive repressor PerR [Pelotomaculum sp. PtaU1.Bin035]
MQEKNILDQLRKNGYKITPQRQEILRTLQTDPRPQSAEDIYRKISAYYPNISLDTVYRNMAILQELGIVSKLNFQDGKNRFEINHADGHHHHHLVCIKCGDAKVVDLCPFKSLDKTKLAKEKKFEILGHSFEIFGHCAACRDKLGKHEI